MLEIFRKFDGKKVVMRMETGQTLIATVKVINDTTIETKTNRDTYYIHPSGVRFIREFRDE